MEPATAAWVLPEPSRVMAGAMVSGTTADGPVPLLLLLPPALSFASSTSLASHMPLKLQLRRGVVALTRTPSSGLPGGRGGAQTSKERSSGHLTRRGTSVMCLN